MHRRVAHVYAHVGAENKLPVTATAQPHNLKFFQKSKLSCIRSGEKMNKRKIFSFNQWGSAVPLAASAALESFLGWTKRFGNKEVFFVSSAAHR